MKIAVYGTLRQGCSLNGYYLDGYEPVSTERIEGYRMVSNGAFPYVTPTEGREITVEVYDVDLKNEAIQSMIAMELGAGYTLAEIDTSVGTAYMFTANIAKYPSIVDRYKEVESGDWLDEVKALTALEGIEYA